MADENIGQSGNRVAVAKGSHENKKNPPRRAKQWRRLVGLLAGWTVAHGSAGAAAVTYAWRVDGRSRGQRRLSRRDC